MASNKEIVLLLCKLLQAPEPEQKDAEVTIEKITVTKF